MGNNTAGNPISSTLIAANIKTGITIFGILSSMPAVPANTNGAAGALVTTIPAGYSDGTKTTTANDADLIAGNIKNGVNLFGVVGTLSGGGLGGNTIYDIFGNPFVIAGVAYNENIGYATYGTSSGAPYVTGFSYDDGTFVYGWTTWKYASNSNLNTTVKVIKINKTTNVTTVYEQSTLGPTSAGGTRINMTIKTVNYSANQIGMVYGGSLNDGLIVFNTSSNTFTTNTYTYGSNDKSFAGTPLSDASTTTYNIFGGTYKIRRVFYGPGGSCYHNQWVITP